MTPYDTVLLDWRERTLLIVDMDNGENSEFQLPVAIDNPDSVIAVGSDGAIYVYDGLFRTPDPPFSRSIIARLDQTMSEWTTTILDRDIDAPMDMEFRPDGDLTVAGEFDVFDIDLTAESVRRSDFGWTESLDNLMGVEMNSSGTITVGSFGAFNTALFRQIPGAEFAERFDTGIRLADFVDRRSAA